MKKIENGSEVPWWQPSVLLFFRLSGWIAGPVIIAVFIGKYLDNKYGTDPWIFLTSVGIAFVLSSFGIVRDTVREMKKIEKEALEKKQQEKNQT